MLNGLRWLGAWTAYGCGHVIYLVFDRGLPFIGLRGPIYRAYHWFILLSDDIQGDTLCGPWQPLDPTSPRP